MKDNKQGGTQAGTPHNNGSGGKRNQQHFQNHQQSNTQSQQQQQNNSSHNQSNGQKYKQRKNNMNQQSPSQHQSNADKEEKWGHEGWEKIKLEEQKLQQKTVPQPSNQLSDDTKQKNKNNQTQNNSSRYQEPNQSKQQQNNRQTDTRTNKATPALQTVNVSSITSNVISPLLSPHNDLGASQQKRSYTGAHDSNKQPDHKQGNSNIQQTQQQYHGQQSQMPSYDRSILYERKPTSGSQSHQQQYQISRDIHNDFDDLEYGGINDEYDEESYELSQTQQKKTTIPINGLDSEEIRQHSGDQSQSSNNNGARMGSRGRGSQYQGGPGGNFYQSYNRGGITQGSGGLPSQLNPSRKNDRMNSGVHQQYQQHAPVQQQSIYPNQHLGPTNYPSSNYGGEQRKVQQLSKHPQSQYDERDNEQQAKFYQQKYQERYLTANGQQYMPQSSKGGNAPISQSTRQFQQQQQYSYNENKNYYDGQYYQGNFQQQEYDRRKQGQRTFQNSYPQIPQAQSFGANDHSIYYEEDDQITGSSVHNQTFYNNQQRNQYHPRQNYQNMSRLQHQNNNIMFSPEDHQQNSYQNSHYLQLQVPAGTLTQADAELKQELDQFQIQSFSLSDPLYLDGIQQPGLIVEQDNQVILTFYITVSNIRIRVKVRERDNIDELARRFVYNCMNRELLQMSEHRQTLLINSIAFMIQQQKTLLLQENNTNLQTTSAPFNSLGIGQQITQKQQSVKGSQIQAYDAVEQIKKVDEGTDESSESKALTISQTPTVPQNVTYQYNATHMNVFTNTTQPLLIQVQSQTQQQSASRQQPTPSTLYSQQPQQQTQQQAPISNKQKSAFPFFQGSPSFVPGIGGATGSLEGSKSLNMAQPVPLAKKTSQDR